MADGIGSRRRGVVHPTDQECEALKRIVDGNRFGQDESWTNADASIGEISQAAVVVQQRDSPWWEEEGREASSWFRSSINWEQDCEV